MTTETYHRTTCRLCDSHEVVLAVPMAPSAIADAYLPPESANESSDRYPLDLYLCSDCGHVQLLDVVAPTSLFQNYSFRTSSCASSQPVSVLWPLRTLSMKAAACR